MRLLHGYLARPCGKSYRVGHVCSVSNPNVGALGVRANFRGPLQSGSDLGLCPLQGFSTFEGSQVSCGSICIRADPRAAVGTRAELRAAPLTFNLLRLPRYIVAQIMGSYIACLLIYVQYGDIIKVCEAILVISDSHTQ